MHSCPKLFTAVQPTAANVQRHGCGHPHPPPLAPRLGGPCGRCRGSRASPPLMPVSWVHVGKRHARARRQLRPQHAQQAPTAAAAPHTHPHCRFYSVDNPKLCTAALNYSLLFNPQPPMCSAFFAGLSTHTLLCCDALRGCSVAPSAVLPPIPVFWYAPSRSGLRPTRAHQQLGEHGAKTGPPVS